MGNLQVIFLDRCICSHVYENFKSESHKVKSNFTCNKTCSRALGSNTLFCKQLKKYLFLKPENCTFSVKK